MLSSAVGNIVAMCVVTSIYTQIHTHNFSHHHEHQLYHRHHWNIHFHSNGCFLSSSLLWWSCVPVFHSHDGDHDDDGVGAELDAMGSNPSVHTI